MQTGGGSSAGKMERATFGEPRVQYFHDFHPLEHIGSCTLLHASSKVYGCMQGRRLVMQGHYPRSSAAFLHGQAWPCFSIGECTAAHVHRISRRSVYYNFVQDAAVDLEAFFTRKDYACVYRPDTLQTFFSLLGVHRCGSPQAEACFYMRYCEHVFCCEMCVVSSFSSSLHSLAAWFRRFFSTRDFKWPALSEVNRATFYQ